MFSPVRKPFALLLETENDRGANISPFLRGQSKAYGTEGRRGWRFQVLVQILPSGLSENHVSTRGRLDPGCACDFFPHAFRSVLRRSFRLAEKLREAPEYGEPGDLLPFPAAPPLPPDYAASLPVGPVNLAPYKSCPLSFNNTGAMGVVCVRVMIAFVSCHQPQPGPWPSPGPPTAPVSSADGFGLPGASGSGIAPRASLKYQVVRPASRRCRHGCWMQRRLVPCLAA